MQTTCNMLRDAQDVFGRNKEGSIVDQIESDLYAMTIRKTHLTINYRIHWESISLQVICS